MRKIKTGNSRKKGFWMLGLIVVLLILSGWYGSCKVLPTGISVDSDWVKTEDLTFLYDLTYSYGEEIKKEQHIFENIYDVVKNAEEFIVVDMFLFNDDYDRKFQFPHLSSDFATVLAEKKKKNPEMKIIVITDEINTFYGVYESKVMEILKEAEIPVVITNLDVLRNSNTLYSGAYGMGLKWLGTEGKGWIQNPFGKSSPKVTLRSYLRMFNFKANHRKTIVTEKEGLISSANPHDGSSNHSNIAFKVKGDLAGILLKSELAVMALSGYTCDIPFEKKEHGGSYDVKLITEGKIRENLVDAINRAQSGDEIWMGMFYLSERSIIKALSNATNRDVDVKLVLDANKDAFGMEKIGIPNRPVASELKAKTKDNIAIRWYETHGEQFHSKLTMIKYAEEKEVIILGGSANLTRRNIDDFNLETDVCVRASYESVLSQEVEQYFKRIWNNEDGQYTLDYEVFREDTLWKKIVYRIQEFSGLSTF